MIAPDIGAQLRKGVVEFCVLGLLDREPMYGWQLSERLTAHGMIASIGTLYPVLTRLREKGLVTSYEEASASGPVRRYYRLTPSGTAQLRTFRAQWTPFTATVAEIVGGVTTHAPIDTPIDSPIHGPTGTPVDSPEEGEADD